MHFYNILKSFLFSFCTILSIQAFSQKQANVWHLGNNRSIDFSSGEPVEVPGSAINAYEGCASYCDSLGNLLFYSNGGGYETFGPTGNIWNAANQSIYDMQGIEGGGYSAMQSSVFIEAPGETGKYYLFTMDDGEFYLDASDSIMNAQPQGRGLSYFKIDKSLNNGLGGVLEADQRVYAPSSEALCAVKHANGNDYWILINQDSSGIGIYSVTSAGVQLSSVFNIPEGTFYLMKASPDGTKIFVLLNEFPAGMGVLLQFDPATGILSDPQELSTYEGFFYFEFSPNSRYLYFANGATIGRYDLNSSNVANSYTSFFDFSNIDGFSYISQMQLGPDGKLYILFVEYDSSIELPVNTLNRIACPNTANPVFEYEVLTFVGNPSFGNFNGLPNFSAWLFENYDDTYVSLGPDVIRLCDVGDTLVLNAQNPGATYAWSTGSTAQTITVTEPGTYSVTVNGACGFGSDEVVVQLCSNNTVDCTSFDLGDTLTVCGNDTLQLQANLSGFANVTGLQWTGGAGTYIPSDTVAAPRYVPTTAERAQGFVNLSLQVNATNSTEGQGGRLIAYDHLSEDLVFYISPLDGSIDTIQDNAGDDWVATGFESATSTLYGVSVFLGLGSLNITSGVEVPINFGYPEDIFSGEFDNVNGVFYAVGAPPQTTADPVNQQLYRINTSAGALTVVGNLNLFTNSSSYFGLDEGINGLAYDPAANVLYGISYSGNLYRINVNDASSTLVGPTAPDCRGLAYDAASQKLWAINSNATLYEIDKNTGSVLSTVPCQVPFNFITSLTYAPEPFEIQEFTCTDTVHVVLSSDAFLSLGNDTLLCNTPQFTLSQPGFSNYLWQDGTEDDQFIASASGEYILQASNSAGCIDTDTLSIQFVNFSVTATASPTSILVGDTVQLNVSGAFSYLWNPEEGLSCSNCASPFAIPSESTTYIVSAIDSNGCRSSDTLRVEVDIRCKEPFIPTIFSPNGKGPQANETLCVLSDCVEQFKLVIHNRWGERIFESEDIKQCWDGTFKGVEAASGVYAFNVYVKQLDGTVLNKTGTISLLR